MVKRGEKPNRNVEESLHHSPVTGMLDGILLREIRTVCPGTNQDLAAAEQAALQMSWHLHAVLGRKLHGA
jgi:hypothetical protein